MLSIATASVPNGYFGDRQTVAVCLLGRRVVCVLPGGSYYTPPVPADVADRAEAEWLLLNHPAYKRYFASVEIS